MRLCACAGPCGKRRRVRRQHHEARHEQCGHPAGCRAVEDTLRVVPLPGQFFRHMSAATQPWPVLHAANHSFARQTLSCLICMYRCTVARQKKILGSTLCGVISWEKPQQWHIPAAGGAAVWHGVPHLHVGGVAAREGLLGVRRVRLGPLAGARGLRRAPAGCLHCLAHLVGSYSRKLISEVGYGSSCMCSIVR